MIKSVAGVVKVRSMRAVFAPIGSERLVSKQEAAVLALLGNAEIVRDETPKPPKPKPLEESETEPKAPDEKAPEPYHRRDMIVEEPTRGPARKPRQ